MTLPGRKKSRKGEAEKKEGGLETKGGIEKDGSTERHMGALTEAESRGEREQGSYLQTRHCTPVKEKIQLLPGKMATSSAPAGSPPPPGRARGRDLHIW